MTDQADREAESLIKRCKSHFLHTRNAHSILQTEIAAALRMRDEEIERLKAELRDTTWQDHADYWQKECIRLKAENK